MRGREGTPIRGITAIVAITLTACGMGEGDARAILTKDGFTNIQLTKAGKAWSFTANKNGEDCTGTLTGTKSSYSSTSSCVPAGPIEPPKPIRACSKETPNVCRDEGIEKAKAKDFAGAIDRYTKGCEFGEGGSCNNLGVLYKRGDGVAADRGKALELYAKACALKQGIACENQGLLLEGDKKYDDARKAYDQGCQLAHASSCNDLADLMNDADAGKPDAAGSFAQRVKTCAMTVDPQQRTTDPDLAKDNAAAILDACGLVGRAHVKGEGVPKDVATGQKELIDACDKGSSMTCFNLGVFERSGVLGRKDLESSLAHFVKACDADYGNACSEAGYAYENAQGTTKDLPKAAKLYEKACNLDSEFGCVNWGITLRDGTGIAAKDPKKAAEAFDKSCAKGNKEACRLRKLLPP